MEFEPCNIDPSGALIMGTIPCGPGELPLDEGVWTPLEDELSRHPEATRFLKTRGTSMVGFGILPGDIIVYDELLDPRPDDLVVVFIRGEGYMVKSFQPPYLIGNNGRSRRKITRRAETTIVGVVTAVINIKRR